MGQESNYENLLSYIGQYENAMQDDFDEMSTASNATPASGGNSDAENLAIDAINAENQISRMTEMNGQPGDPNYAAMLSGISGDLLNQLSAIFNNDDVVPQNLVTFWQKAWAQPTSASASNSISPVTNAFSAISNDISSQSSVAQSELKYYEANDEQYKSMDHDIMTELVNGEKTAIQAAQNASN